MVLSLKYCYSSRIYDNRVIIIKPLRILYNIQCRCCYLLLPLCQESRKLFTIFSLFLNVIVWLTRNDCSHTKKKQISLCPLHIFTHYRLKIDTLCKKLVINTLVNCPWTKCIKVSIFFIFIYLFIQQVHQQKNIKYIII